MAEFWRVPEGVRVAADGAWTVGGLPIRHAPSLRELKSKLHFAEEGAYLLDGPSRLPIALEGPAFEVTRLRIDPDRGEGYVLLDDGTEEPLYGLGMDETTGRLCCVVREGNARAILSRGAHQALMELVEVDDDHWFVAIGLCRLPVRV
jgi:hypothetical protein